MKPVINERHLVCGKGQGPPAVGATYSRMQSIDVDENGQLRLKQPYVRLHCGFVRPRIEGLHPLVRCREVKASHLAANVNRVVLVMGLRYERVKRTPILHASSCEMNMASDN